MPPNVAFVSPPMEVSRSAPEENMTDPEAYSPRQLPLEILIEFPDGHSRQIRESSLSVDGVIVQTNSSPPFERFVWDLTEYISDGDHILVAEALDSLEITGRSVDTKVTISMDFPRQNVLTIVSRNRSLLAIMAVLIAGSVLLLVLVMGGRLHPGTLRDLRRKRRRADPVTQPVPVRSEPLEQTKPTWMNRLPWQQHAPVPKAFAYLVPIAESGEERSTPPLSISCDEESFGREVDRVTQLLDDGSVEAVHARLVRDQEGNFRVFDEGSVAGTWVNYMPISKEGVNLEHGDLIHFGRLGFRFVEREPRRVRKPVIKPGNSSQ
jgi:hypothetical protein